ncbi:DUF1294 domain-containing protein [Ruminococcaceae bacterium OttesenSCG-928-L11]|nr:DUF1294 domain-containing protein [Ruminococcaceae bacterium OttesenSCG-928-L11]
MQYGYIGLAIWNLAVCFLYGMDKYRARQGLWRVSEKTLLWCTLLGGGAGGLAGMLLFATRYAACAFSFWRLWAA